MAVLKVNPNRMELSRLKARLETAKRGHKLLKDKCDEMVRRFMLLIRENRELRKTVEEKLLSSQKDFLMADMLMSPEDTAEAMLMPVKDYSIDVSVSNIMGVTVPQIEYSEKKSDKESDFYTFGTLNTSGELDIAVENLAETVPYLIKLAGIEKACNMLAIEIEKTRRRVNALEYATIPQLEETIRFIKMRLDENERSNTTRLMKMKDIMNK